MSDESEALSALLHEERRFAPPAELTEKLTSIHREIAAAYIDGYEKSSLTLADYQEETAKASRDKEESQLRSVEAQVTPVFNKYRFAGQLGNAQQEAAFDRAIWDQALAKLEELPEDQPLTAAVVEKEFRSVYTAFQAAIGKKANAKAKAIVDNKKQEAASSVAVAATRGLGGQPQGQMDKMAASIRRGGVGGLTQGLMDIINSGRK